MLAQEQLNKIKEIVEEFFMKMTLPTSSIEVSVFFDKKEPQNEDDFTARETDVVELNIKSDEPQILIGQGGQTLFEIQRLLKTILNKKLGKSFYFNLDINDYKKKKVEYLKNLAKELADQASLTKEEKSLSPMSAYERRIIHSELSQRTDVITESHGCGLDRHIVIRPK